MWTTDLTSFSSCLFGGCHCVPSKATWHGCGWCSGRHYEPSPPASSEAYEVPAVVLRAKASLQSPMVVAG